MSKGLPVQLRSVQPPEDVAELISVFTTSHRPARPPCIDHDVTDYQIHACDKCEKWWAEVVHDSRGRLIVREWHEGSCEVLHEIEWE
jgi:hypothetical protein